MSKWRKKGKKLVSLCLCAVLAANMLEWPDVVVFAAPEENVTIESEEWIELAPIETSAPQIGFFSLDDGNVNLKSENAINWVDRVDWEDAAIIREFYNKLVEASDNDGTDDFLISDSYYTSSPSSIEIAKVSGHAATEGEVSSAASEILNNYSNYITAAGNAFDRDHPEVFWLSGSQRMSSSTSFSGNDTNGYDYTVTISYCLINSSENFDVRDSAYRDENTIKAAISAMNTRADELVTAASSKSTLEKIKYYNEQLTKTNEYNTSSNLNNIAHDCRECVSALAGRTGEAGPVCEAYARAFKVLCDKSGIPCVLVDGNAGTSEGSRGPHMWNYVQLEGNWYGVDVTWNDPTGGASGAVSGFENEKWLLVGSETEIGGSTFITSHPVSNTVSTGGLSFTNGPEISQTKYAADETAPQINKVKASEITDTGATVNVTAADEQGGIAKYYLYHCPSTESSESITVEYIKENGVQNTTGSFGLSGLTPNTSYKVFAIAEDAAGNCSTINSDCTFTTLKSVIQGTAEINGGAVYGQILIAVANVKEGLDAGALSYQWYRVNGTAETAITSATAETYTLAEEDINCKVTVKVSGANCSGTLDATSEMVVKADCPDVNKPSNPVTNDAAGTDTFSFTGKDGVAYEYSLDAGKTWSDVSGNTREITIGNVSYAIGIVQVRAKETNVYKASESISNATAFTSSLEGSVTLSGDAVYGKTLTAEVSGIQTGVNPIYSFYAGEEERQSGDKNTYEITAADVGKTIMVKVSAAGYSGELKYSLTGVVGKKQGYSVDDVNKSYLYSKSNSDTIDLSTYLPKDCGNATYNVSIVSGNSLFTTQPSVSLDRKVSYTLASGTVSDTAEFKVTVTSEYYADFSITVKVTLIDKIPVILQAGSEVALENNILSYGDSLSTLRFKSAVFVENGTGKVVSGTLAWKDPSAKPAIGTTSAAWVFTPEGEEYKAVEGMAAINVKKASPKITTLPTVGKRVYDPAKVLQDSELSGGTVYVGENEIEGVWSWKTAGQVPEVNNNGYEAVFTPNDTNYDKVTGKITVEVDKAKPYIVTKPDVSEIVYGQTLSDAVITGGAAQHSETTAAAVEGSFAFKMPDTKPTAADSNTTVYKLVFMPTSQNYDTVEAEVSLTVKKALNAPNMPKAEISASYSCEKVSDVALSDGWVWDAADQDKLLEMGRSITAVAIYNGSDRGNYEKESVTVSIVRAVCEHEAGEILYTGTGEHEPTCTQSGLGHTICVKCGDTVEDNIVIAATGHSYTSKVTKQPTAAEEGVRTFICSKCEHSYTEAIPKLMPTEPDEEKPTVPEPDEEKPVIPEPDVDDSDDYEDDDEDDSVQIIIPVGDKTASVIVPPAAVDHKEVISHNEQKGYISTERGIITGTGKGYSEWKQDANGWQLKYAGGDCAAGNTIITGYGNVIETICWEKVNGSWYCFGSDGYADFGWVFDDLYNSWFYIDVNCGMKTGWHYDKNAKWYYLNSDGMMAIGWTMVDGQWYYLTSEGECLINTITPDGYMVDESGAWVH